MVSPAAESERPYDASLRQGQVRHALKTALAGELEQSPFLNVLPDQRMQQTLTLMSRPANERVTQNIAREICQRTQSRALLAGSIAPLGSHYVIGLNAQNCVTGDSLAQEEAEASRKEDVLKALDQATTKLREKLGEALPSVQKFDVPVEATTPSLEALKTFSLGIRAMREKGDPEAAFQSPEAVVGAPVSPADYARRREACTSVRPPLQLDARPPGFPKGIILAIRHRSLQYGKHPIFNISVLMSRRPLQRLVENPLANPAGLWFLDARAELFWKGARK